MTALKKPVGEPLRTGIDLENLATDRLVIRGMLDVMPLGTDHPGCWALTLNLITVKKGASGAKSMIHLSSVFTAGRMTNFETPRCQYWDDRDEWRDYWNNELGRWAEPPYHYHRWLKRSQKVLIVWSGESPERTVVRTLPRHNLRFLFALYALGEHLRWQSLSGLSTPGINEHMLSDLRSRIRGYFEEQLRPWSQILQPNSF